MKKVALLLISIFLYGTIFSQTGPGAILPAENETPGWRISGKLQTYDYENLDNLIDGEADLYREYGLKNAISRDYFNFSGIVINIRVFTFDKTFGSYGLFLQKSKGEKVFKEYGNACFEKRGSFTFWKQYYLIVMSSKSSGDSISAGYRLMAGLIDSKIKSKGLFPEIMGLSKDKTGDITIFKGPLALSNIYYFGPRNYFNINEGIAIENADRKEIILKYIDNNEAVGRFSDAAGILGAMSKFSGFKMAGNYSFEMKDKEGKTLTFKVDGDCMYISIE
jgi:hypothetical protein